MTVAEDQTAIKLRKGRHTLTTVGILVAAVALVGLLAYGLSLDPKRIPSVFVGKPAQGFSAAWISGQKHIPKAAESGFRLEDIKGRPVVLNFWASWCVSCRAEAAELEAFWQKHQADVLVVGVAIQDETDAAIKFAKYYGKTYALGLDVDGKAAIDYGVAGVPETFLIDASGIIRHKVVGPVTVASLEGLLGKFK